jgi:hypothetical protein
MVKQRQQFQLDDVPDALSTPISRALPGAAAIETEMLGKFQVALEYFGIAEPLDEHHRRRLFVVFDLAFPNAFRVPDDRGPKTKRIADHRNLKLFRWVEEKAGQSEPPKPDSEVIRGALLAANKKEFLDRFPWLKGTREGTILNLVSKGRKLAEEEAAWEKDYVYTCPQPAKKVSHN